VLCSPLSPFVFYDWLATVVVFIVGNPLIPNWNCDSAIPLCICYVKKVVWVKTGVLSAIGLSFCCMGVFFSLVLPDTLVFAADLRTRYIILQHRVNITRRQWCIQEIFLFNFLSTLSPGKESIPVIQGAVSTRNMPQ
jgi:hypothetical protein